MKNEVISLLIGFVVGLLVATIVFARERWVLHKHIEMLREFLNDTRQRERSFFEEVLKLRSAVWGQRYESPSRIQNS